MPAIPSVLIVDDNADSRCLLSELLSALGTERIVEAASAEEGLATLAKESFAIILSDYRLEGMDGSEFIARLRESGNATPVLMVSGSPEQKAVLRATALPKVDFFPKPFRIADLQKAMERLLAA